MSASRSGSLRRQTKDAQALNDWTNATVDMQLIVADGCVAVAAQVPTHRRPSAHQKEVLALRWLSRP